MRRTLALLAIITGLIFAAGQSFGQLPTTGAGKFPSGAPAGVAFDPANASAHTLLSNSNLTATADGTISSSAGSALTTTSHNTGKFYAEFTITNMAAPYMAVGLANGSFNVSTVVLGTADDNSVGAYWHLASSGFVLLHDAALTTTQQTAGTSAVIRLAVDIGGKLLWVAVNSGSWNNDAGANPATGAIGLDISGLAAGPYFLAAEPYGAPANAWTMNVGNSAYGFTPPSGFGNW